MPDDPAQPFAGLTRWLSDDTGDSPSMPSSPATHREHPRRPSLRRGTRAAALVAPWLLVIAVLAAPPRTTGSGAAAGSQPPGGTTTTRPSTTETAPPRGTAPPADAAPPAPAAAGATATRLVRDAVTGRRAGATTALDVAVPETPQSLGSRLWLVRVHAVLLHGDARRWRTATHEIWAVPLGVRAGRLIGLDHPWRVATDDSRIAPARWEPATVDEAAVRAALRTVGAQPAHDLEAEQHPEVADIIRVQVAGSSQRRHVWLRTTPTVRVLGAPTAPAERPTIMPTERPRS